MKYKKVTAVAAVVFALAAGSSAQEVSSPTHQTEIGRIMRFPSAAIPLCRRNPLTR